MLQCPEAGILCVENDRVLPFVFEESTVAPTTESIETVPPTSHPPEGVYWFHQPMCFSPAHMQCVNLKKKKDTIHLVENLAFDSTKGFSYILIMVIYELASHHRFIRLILNFDSENSKNVKANHTCM